MSRRTALLAALLVVVGSVAVGAPAEAVVRTATGARCTVVGTGGNDRLSGTNRNDVICGRGGNDVIVGRGGSDLVDAGTGNDLVRGGDGNDVVLAGAGNDTVTGEAGNDRLYGGAGNDDLDGGAGRDAVSGGTGTNWCLPAAGESRTGCAYDRTPARADQALLSASTIDVTAADASVTVKAHVTDDTGATWVGVSAGVPGGGAVLATADAKLVSGTVRDGWWLARLVARRYSEPGRMTLVVSTRDRVDREGGGGFADAVLTVVDRDPDVTPPAPTLLSPTADATYDVRGGARTVPLSARVVDAQSGTARVVFTLNKPADGYYGLLPGSYATLVSGTPADGVWQGSVTIPAGETGGDWNVSVDAIDVAHGNQASAGDRWVGPDLWRAWTNDGTRVSSSWLHQLPAGQGRFTVLGSSDSTPPSITAAALTPDRIDTRTSAAQVTVRVHAVDPEGVTRVAYDVRTRPRDGSDPFQRSATLTLTSGTPQDGEWTGTLTFPQGTPPDVYVSGASVQDSRHFRSYVGASSPFAGTSGTLRLPGDPTVTVVDTSTP